MDRDRDNLVRWPADGKGHYESFYLRAHHPELRMGFWLKYNLLERKGAPLVGELWGVHFDGEAGRHTVVKENRPAEAIGFERDRPQLRIGEAAFEGLAAHARIEEDGGTFAWDLQWRAEVPPLHHFPYEALYRTAFPKKKIMTPAPVITYQGHLEVNGRRVDVDGWRGLQGHNWGKEHARTYAYANSNEFVGRPGTYMDGFSARIPLGPFTSPYLTVICLCHEGEMIRFDSPLRWIDLRAFVGYFAWSFEVENGTHRLEGTIAAEREDMVGLYYENPDGRRAHCLNTKFGKGTLYLHERSGSTWWLRDELHSERFELEILVPRGGHGVPMHGNR